MRPPGQETQPYSSSHMWCCIVWVCAALLLLWNRMSWEPGCRKTPHGANANVRIKKKKSMLRKHLAPGGPITELIFPGRLFFSFHSPCYAASVTRHRGLDLGLWTQSELCPFSPFTSCLTVGLLLHFFEPHLYNEGRVVHIAPIGLWKE